MGDSRGNERGFDESFATAVRGKIQSLLYICIKGPWNKKIAGIGENSSGFTNETRQGWAFSGFFAGPKVKVPVISRGWGWGGGGMVTND